MLKAYMEAGRLEAGCDEAGRGCLAGPVVAAAVILPRGYTNEALQDSKQLSERRREQLRPIVEREALAWGVGEASVEEIDRLNILHASILAMHRAVAALSTRPEFLLVDGNRFTAIAGLPHATIVKGDATYMSIAAASILAKTHRDEVMRRLAAEFPGYGWDQNMGYPTKDHRRALAELGLTVHHRRSFGPCKELLK